MKNRILYISLGIVILVLWELVGSQNNTFRLLLSSPSLSFGYFIENSTLLLEATAVTFFEALSGLLIAIVFSFGMMFISFYYPKFMGFILPVMVTSQVIPLIVLAPFFIILLGLGVGSKIAMAALLCFFPVFVNFAQGFQSIPDNLHDLLDIYNTRTWNRIRKVYIPLSMPSILAGLKISATLSIIGAIVAEFTGAEKGLGKNLFLAAKRLEPELMMNSLFFSALLGAVLFGVIVLLEKQIIKWHIKSTDRGL